MSIGALVLPIYTYMCVYSTVYIYSTTRPTSMYMLVHIGSKHSAGRARCQHCAVIPVSYGGQRALLSAVRASLLRVTVHVVSTISNSCFMLLCNIFTTNYM